MNADKRTTAGRRALVFRRVNSPLDPVAAKTERRALQIAQREGYCVERVYRVFEPVGGEAEVLFVGHYAGDWQAGIPGDPHGTTEPFTVTVRDDGTGYVCVGW